MFKTIALTSLSAMLVILLFGILTTVNVIIIILTSIIVVLWLELQDIKTLYRELVEKNSDLKPRWLIQRKLDNPTLHVIYYMRDEGTYSRDEVVRAAEAKFQENFIRFTILDYSEYVNFHKLPSGYAIIDSDQEYDNTWSLHRAKDGTVSLV